MVTELILKKVDMRNVDQFNVLYQLIITSPYQKVNLFTQIPNQCVEFYFQA